MGQYTVDLTNCDKEPIHILGKVQLHGFLVAIHIETGLITFISENISPFVHREASYFLGKDLIVLGRELKPGIPGSDQIFEQIVNLNFNSTSLESYNPYFLELDNKPFNIIISASGKELLLEFEPCGKGEFDTERTIGRSISKILSGASLASLLSNAAKEIREIIKYDRVMVYQFGAEGHGHVIAEDKNTALEPFLGLNYPASDIPKQARELYKLNLTRIIADVNAEPSPILKAGGQSESLDLSHSELRAVSPMHIQYLKNMGVTSSFSISLISKGELWGLISCHNYSPRFINYKARQASKLIAQILSSALEYRQGEEDADKFALLVQKTDQLVEMIDHENQLIAAITQGEVTIKDVTNATGVAIIFENTITTIGITPDEEQINEISSWLLKNSKDSVYHTHRFPDLYKPAMEYSGIASGMISCMLSRELKEMIIWFKPERVQSVNWAGNPEKPVEINGDGTMQLTPRKSFESWTEIVKYSSEKWNRAEISAVVSLREHLIYSIKRKANEIRKLNEKLVTAYEELDTFSFTISHDLRTPLSAIKGFTEFLLVSNKSLDDNAKFILGKISSCTDKMAFLMQEILNYSRIGKTDFATVEIDMKNVLTEIKTEALTAFNYTNLQLTIGDTPPVSGDSVMISQVFSNLIGNALKYSVSASPQIIHVEGKITNDETIYTVSDNGMGIDVTYHNRVFELFKRMDNVKDIDGTGVGLAIVKRIVDKHEGRIWFESTLGAGTTFYVALKNK